MKTCTTCKHYTANSCYAASKIITNPVTGLPEIINVKNAGNQRRFGFIASLIKRKCGKGGRYHELRIN